MVSLGTIITLGIIGAFVAGGYALYANSNKIGGALSRGVETNLTNPLGNYFDNLWTGANTNAQNTTGGPVQQAQQKASGTNPTPGIVNPLPTASAQIANGTTGITPNYASELSQRLLPKAQQSANTALSILSPSSQTSLLKAIEPTALKSPTPALTQAQLIVDKVRLAPSYKDDPTRFQNKFYNLFTLANKPWGGFTKPLPLSTAAVQNYAKQGVIAREVYL